MSSSQTSQKNLKRKAENSVEGSGDASKVAKVHPFFAKRTMTSGDGDASTSSFRWLDSLGPKRTCFHAVNLNPKSSPKVATFDLDGTLIKSTFNSPDWQWWRSSVPDKLRKVHEDGYSVVIISNQALKPGPLKQWKAKVSIITAAIHDVPFRIFAATAKDQFRKPMPGMWNELGRIFKEEGVIIDKSASFYVGDAAGRVYDGKAKPDFAASDRKWALNVGIPFYTPEEYFLNLSVHVNYKLDGFTVSSLPINLPLVTPMSSSIVPVSPQQELVLFAGFPCLGKSSFYRRHFEPAGYQHVNQDILKSRPKCVKAVETALGEGKCVVVDNTNRDVVTRKYYVDIAKKMRIPVRCFYFTGSMELAWHNNLYRAFNLPPSVAEKEPKREILPYLALTSFRDAFEEPSMSEGFTEIRKVNWVFEGTEEERRCWSMWLDIK